MRQFIKTHFVMEKKSIQKAFERIESTKMCIDAKL